MRKLLARWSSIRTHGYAARIRRLPTARASAMIVNLSHAAKELSRSVR